MGIATEMERLTEDIIASYDARVKAVRELAHDVQKTLKEFGSDRAVMSKEQAGTLKDFMGNLRENVAELRKGFQKEHKENAGELNGNLARGEADRMKDFNDMMKDIQEVVKDVKTYVAGKLEEFSDSRSVMSRELKKDLAKYYMDDIEKETKILLNGFAGERKTVSSNWRHMVAALAEKRGAHQTDKAEPEIAETEEAKPKKMAVKPKKVAAKSKRKAGKKKGRKSKSLIRR